MDRKLFKVPFDRKRSPDWICPHCRKGVLRFVEGSFHCEERRNSREARGHDAWDPDWIESIYSGLLCCANDQCKEVVATAGIGGVEDYTDHGPDGEPEQVWAEFFKPKYFEPPLAIIDLPKECPSSVSGPIQESFRLFFCNPPSASNCLRMALEELLTELGIKRFAVSDGKRRVLSLHKRIGLLPIKYAELRDLLFAIKWLGNSGSHADGAITLDDVMDAYELVDHVLQELYTQRSKKAKDLAKLINKNKGPKS